MGWAILSKSLTQFSVDGWVCVLSLLCVLRPSMVEVIKIMVTSFTMSHAHTATLSTPDPVASHHQPMPPPETPGHSQASLAQSLVGSLLLSPGSWCTQGFVCALQDSASPVLHVEKAMAPHSSTLAWRIPRMEEPGRLQSRGSQRGRQDQAANTFTFYTLASQKGNL